MAEPFERFLNCNSKLHTATAIDHIITNCFNDTNLKTAFYKSNMNLNVVDHDTCKKVQNFLNLLYQNNIISIISKPTRVTKK